MSVLRAVRALAFPPGRRRTRVASALWHGMRGRPATAAPPPAREPWRRRPTPRRFRVAFLAGMLEYNAVQYRVRNLVHALRGLAMEVDSLVEPELEGRLLDLMSWDLLIVFRTAGSERTRGLIEALRRHGVVVVYDCDDLVFDPDVVEHVDGIRTWGAGRRADYLEGVRRYRALLGGCDAFTGPTRLLVERAAAMGLPSHLVPNGLGREWIEACAAVARDETGSVGRIVLGYFPGTATHQHDFAVAASAVARVLRERPVVDLRVTTALDLTEFPELTPFGSRITVSPLRAYPDYAAEIARTDVNLAPLEVGNPFCEAKSALKYFEPAALGIPTVASPTEPFRAAIRDGESGFLASTEDDWYARLTALTDDEELRRRVGRNAREDALAHFGPAVAGREALAVYRRVLAGAREANGLAAEALTIVFLLSPPSRGSGGHKDVFLIANELVSAGHDVSILFVEGDGAAFEREIRAHFVEPRFGILVGAGIPASDVLVATDYESAYWARKYRDRAHVVAYFVQDYEPWFHPMSGERLRAARTYGFGFRCITLGPWLCDMLATRHGVEASPIPFWLDRRVYRPTDENPARRDAVVFFARPDMPRRSFPLGIGALHYFHLRNPDVEIVLFGSSATRDIALPFPATDRGVLSVTELARLYGEARVGLALAPTNPSFVPYEMMACRCPVVDLRVEESYDRHKYGSSENVYLADAEAESISDALEAVFADEARRAGVVERAARFVAPLPDVAGAATVFAEHLRRFVAETEMRPPAT